MLLNELQTPCGILRCTDKNNNVIPFRSIPVDHQYDTAVYDHIRSDWTSVYPENQSTILVSTNDLMKDETYIIRLYGEYKYQFGASDENAISNVITFNDHSLSFGAYDPNDDAKDRQWLRVYEGDVCVGAKPPEEYDTSGFRGYILNVLPDWSGYSFKIKDDSLSDVIFRIAWIKHNDELVTEVSDYENAVTLITTF